MASHQDDGLAVEQYRRAEEVLALAGYRHYELSSWARPGHESRHNTAYWQRRPYTGIGAGAHSYDGAAERSWNTRDLDAYVRRAAKGTRAVAGTEVLDEPTRAFEAVALGMRLVDGLSRSDFASEFGLDPVDRYRQALADDGGRLLATERDRLRLTPLGRLFASEASLGFLPADG
jgi:oxygen-independent coproporphyrinogen-3 oxidase